jgi:uncharacterized membrane protein
LIAFVDGITAAAVGAIAGSVVWCAGRAFHYGYSTATLALLTGVLLWKFKQIAGTHHRRKRSTDRPGDFPFNAPRLRISDPEHRFPASDQSLLFA